MHQWWYYGEVHQSQECNDHLDVMDDHKSDDGYAMHVLNHPMMP